MIDTFRRVLALPECARRLERIACDLAAGYGVAWVIPRHVPVSTLITAVAEILEDRGVQVNVARMRADAPPLRHYSAWWVGHECGAGDDRAGDADSVESEFRLSRALVIDAYESGPGSSVGAQTQACAELLREWSQVSRRECKASGICDSTLLMTCDPGITTMLEGDANVRIHWYWGFTSTLALALVGQAAADDMGLPAEAVSWMKSAGAELAGTDVGLLDLLCRSWPVRLNSTDAGDGAGYGRTCGVGSDRGVLMQLLREYAVGRGWTRSWLEEHMLDRTRYRPGARPRLARPPAPSAPAPGMGMSNGPGNGLDLFREGALDWDPDRGTLLHSAAQALLGDVEDINHRIWAGQARLLVPILDGERLEMCKYLEANVKDWVNYCTSSNQSPLDAEFSEMYEYLKRLSTPAFASVHSRARFLRDARNDLAHGTALNWDVFRSVLKWEDD
ncbi:MAG: hypothetical protein KA063_04435 [Firmicutes bacterium]|nr:hypothetical protein [Bacillota bacterium]